MPSIHNSSSRFRTVIRSSCGTTPHGTTRNSRASRRKTPRPIPSTWRSGPRSWNSSRRWSSNPRLRCRICSGCSRAPRQKSWRSDSSCKVRRTSSTLVAAEALDQEFVGQVRRIKATGVVTKVNCRLGELPDFTARPGKTVQPHHKGYLDICPSVDYLERAWDDAKRGEPSKEPFLDCVLHSVMDPSLAPPGKFTLSIYSQYSPYRLRDGDWDDRKEEVGDTILETLARFAPNVPHAVEAREVISPLDMEREWGLPGGCIYQTDMTPDQLFSFRPLPGWSGYRTPVRGLYLCGSSAHPGGGVTGAPGHNAAMVVLDDFAGLRS